MAGRVIDLDRQEGTRADMQGDPLHGYALLAQRCFQRRREMQASSRRRDRALFRRKHRLIVVDVAFVGRALGGNIGRQRCMAEIGDRLVKRRPVKRERQRDLAIVALVLDVGIEMAEQTYPALIAEADHVARGKFLRALHQRLPARTIEPLDQGRLDPRLGFAADAAADKLRRDHLGVVDDELVAGLEPFRKIGDRTVAQHVIGLHDQHSRGVARARRPQRDAVGGKLEVEEFGAHGAEAL